MFHDFFQLFVVNVAVAFACGGAIGLERQIRGKPAGLRVCLIVVLTSAFFITIGREVTPEGGDPTRVLAAVITGVGFLGAGLIFSQGGKVRGHYNSIIGLGTRGNRRRNRLRSRLGRDHGNRYHHGWPCDCRLGGMAISPAPQGVRSRKGSIVICFPESQAPEIRFHDSRHVFQTVAELFEVDIYSPDLLFNGRQLLA